MTEADEKRTRQMLEDVIGRHLGELNNRISLLNASFVNIEKQVTIANGRTRKNEEAIIELNQKEIQHTMTCPNLPRIKALEDSEISRKSISKFIILMITMSAAIGGLIVGILQ